MEYIITINSVTYDGEFASILFNPQDTDVVINLGLVQLPFTFNSGLLDPPREIYGNYTILVQGSDCSKTLRVPVAFTSCVAIGFLMERGTEPRAAK
jgi:hypothetical protein